MPLFLPKISAFGIDLSDLSIKVGKIRKKKSKMVLVSLGEKMISRGLVNDGIIDPKKEGEVAKVIRELLKEIRGEKINTKRAICSLPEESSFIKIIKVPKTRKEEDIGEIIKWQIESNFPVKLKDVYFDWEFIKKPKGNKKENNQKNLEEESLALVSVAVIPKRIVDSYLSVFKRAGIEPIAFEIESMAVVRALIRDYVSSPLIVLDIGRCGTGLTIFSGNTIILSSHIDIGGQLFNEAIEKELKVDLKKAEELKKEIGLLAIKEEEKKSQLSRSEDKIVHVPIIVKDIKETRKKTIKIDFNEGSNVEAVFNSLIPILTDFIEQIQHYISYFRDFGKIEYVPDGRVAKIVLCGGESRLIGIADFISSSIKIPIEFGNPLINIVVSKKIEKEPSFWQFLPYTTVIGLAIRGAE